MKGAMLIGLAFIASATAAFAADPEPVIVPGPFSPPPAYPAGQAGPQRVVTPGPFDPPPAYSMTKVYNWTGFYAGINGGGGFGEAKWFSSADDIGGNSRISGGLAGGTVGYNLQAGDPFVVGFEADLDWAGIKGTTGPTFGPTTTTPPGPACLPPGCELKIPWLGTARVRFGWAFDRILPYVTGGAAAGLLKTDIVGQPFGTNQTTPLGWTVGAGIEFAITDALRAKVEYLHIDLNGYNCDVACNGGPVAFKPNAEIIRAGLNYRFWIY